MSITKKQLSFLWLWSMINEIWLGDDKMICSVHTMGIHGITGSHITVECYITNGLPAFDIVGLPDAAVKEARERVKAAAKVSGFCWAFWLHAEQFADQSQKVPLLVS